jgi:hypothetical protein
MVTVHTCKECGQTFLSWKEFDNHVTRHLQKHLDEFAATIPEKKTPSEAFSNIPEGLDRELLMVFEKYNLGDKMMLCLWRNDRWDKLMIGVRNEADRQDKIREAKQSRMSEMFQKWRVNIEHSYIFD